MGFIQHLINIKTEREFLKEIENIKQLKRWIKESIEAIKKEYDISLDGHIVQYYEYTDGAGKRLYPTIEDWKKEKIDVLANYQTELVESMKDFMQEWLEYVKETGDKDYTWNDVLDIFPFDELVKAVEPESQYLKEKYPPIWFDTEWLV